MSLFDQPTRDLGSGGHLFGPDGTCGLRVQGVALGTAGQALERRCGVSWWAHQADPQPCRRLDGDNLRTARILNPRRARREERADG